MLTEKQRNLLEYIIEQTEAQYSPSFEDMKKYLGVASKSNIYRLVSCLEERGFITRMKNRARSIEVMRNPNGEPYKGKPQRSSGALNASQRSRIAGFLRSHSRVHPSVLANMIERGEYI